MARSLYVPVHLHARLVTPDDVAAATPTLAARPCDPPAGPKLATGVHLHWSLPDALTRASVDADARTIQFPAVPDRWLVIRFAAPPRASSDPAVPPPPRRITAFVVDAKSRRSGPLGQVPFTHEPRWLTAMGLLPGGLQTAADDRLPPDIHLQAAYYPESQDRFGFHDSLADLFANRKILDRRKTANWQALRLSYLVIGSYRVAAEDPLARAADDDARRQWIDAARLHVDLPEPLTVQRVPVLADAFSQARRIDPALISVILPGTDESSERRDPVDALAGLQFEPSRALRSTLEKVHATIEQSTTIAARLQQIDISARADAIVIGEDSDGVPSRLVCHGAVVDVGPAGAYAGLSGPDIQRSIEVAASASAAIESTFAEIGGGEVFAILRGGLDGEIAGAAGMQALPHLLHAAGFDGAPDEATDLEYVGTVQDAAVQPDPGGLQPTTTIRLVDRRTKDGPRVPAGVPASGLANLRAQIKPAVIVVERRVIPRPRWHRPATPVICVEGHGRSFRHGHDGRMRSDGRLQCRAGGQTVTSLTVAVKDASSASNCVHGHGLVEIDPGLRFEPAYVRALIFEAALLDPSNAARAAGLWMIGADQTIADLPARAALAFQAASEGWWPAADPDAAPAADLKAFAGTLPAPLAVTPWRAPWLPLYAEVDYTFTPAVSLSTTNITLEDLDPRILAPQSFPAVAVRTRQVLASALPATLQSAIQRIKSRFDGVAERAAQLAQIVRRLASLDLLTVALPELDPALRAAGHALRGGNLSVTALRLVDTFGQVHELGPVQSELPPRLTHWSRVHTRLVDRTSAADAGPLTSPICGYFLFDSVEQALEVFDPAGAPLGQLRHDRIAATSHWEAAPSRTGTALAAIAPPVLKDIVTLLTAPKTLTTPSALVDTLHVLDTARFTVARRLPGDDQRGLLCRRPVLVLRARLTLELRGAGPSDAPALNVPAKAPDRVMVRLGSLDQIDDALLGYFAATPQGAWHLHVVPDVAGKAWTTGETRHPLIDTSAVLDLIPGQPREVFLLLDGASTFHVQAGLLPRKRIDVSEVVPPRTLAHLLPTLRIGPVLFDTAHPRIAAPALPGNTWSFVERSGLEFATTTLDDFTPALAELPERPVTLREGWLRLDPE